jgi:hypothetical protein
MRRETYGGSGSAFVKMLRLDGELRVTNFEQRAIFVRRACLARREVGKLRTPARAETLIPRRFIRTPLHACRNPIRGWEATGGLSHTGIRP